jgi:hypothetical protein
MYLSFWVLVSFWYLQPLLSCKPQELVQIWLEENATKKCLEDHSMNIPTKCDCN